MKHWMFLAVAASAALAQDGAMPTSVVEEAKRRPAALELVDRIEIVGRPAEACAITALGSDGVEYVGVDGAVRRTEWTNVVSLASARPLTVVLANGDRATAKLAGVDENKVRLESSAFGAVAVGVASLTPMPAPEAVQDPNAPQTPLTPTPWKGSVSLSGSFRSGNTDQVLGALRAALERNWEEDKLAFALEALYGKSEGVENNKSLFAKARYEHHWSERFYGFAQTDALYDAIQDIDLRSVTSVGVGYLLWKENDEKLYGVEAGLSAIYTEYGTGASQFSPAARAAHTFRDVFFKDMRFQHDAEILMPLDETSQWLLRTRTGVAVPVSEGWSMKTSVDVNYTADPAVGRKPFDIIFLVGLEYQF